MFCTYFTYIRFKRVIWFGMAHNYHRKYTYIWYPFHTTLENCTGLIEFYSTHIRRQSIFIVKITDSGQSNLLYEFLPTYTDYVPTKVFWYRPQVVDFQIYRTEWKSSWNHHEILSQNTNFKGIQSQIHVQVSIKIAYFKYLPIRLMSRFLCEWTYF